MTNDHRDSSNKQRRQRVGRCIFLTTLLFSLFYTFAGLAENPKIDINHMVVELGQPCNLSWNSTGTAAYLLGYGIVKPSGSAKIIPTRTQKFTLLVEESGHLASDTISVKVAGQKGAGADHPKLDKFKISVPGEQRTLEYFQFLSHLETTLRDTMHFAVDGEFLPSREYVVLLTDRREKEDLKGKDEKGRNRYRVAYGVFVYKPTVPPTIKFEVKALVESRPVAESDWRIEEDPELAEASALKLREKILSTIHTAPK
jgi:hypothetical protein